MTNNDVLGCLYTGQVEADFASDCHDLGLLYADRGKLAEAEKMYHRALQGYKKALGADSATTYIPALNTIWGFGSLFER
jgi:hypothetical protein